MSTGGPQIFRRHNRRSMTLVVCVVVMISLRLPAGANGRQPSWWGRTCCELSLEPRCKRSCLKAKSIDELSRECKHAVEPSLSMCLDRQAAGHVCCRNANDDQCRAACQSVFIVDTHRPSNTAVKRVLERCNPPLTSCVVNYTASVAWNQLSDESVCCDSGETELCRTNCHRALSTADSEDDALNEVVKYCGDVNSWAPLWQCFLHGATNRLRHQFVHGGTMDVTGVDSAKLSCCSRAVTTRCRQLCLQTYGTRWAENINDFNTHCSFSMQEAEMNACLEEVDEPCKVGCSGLSFCSNFNHRPTETFRSCNSHADDAARRTVRTWEQQGAIWMPDLFGFHIPIKDIRGCEPSAWKAIACLIHIKPCRVMSTTPSICRSDCVQILSKCMESTGAPLELTVGDICDRLSVPNEIAAGQQCLHLSPYLGHSEVTTPCSSNPCQANQVCLVNRDRCGSSRPGGNASTCLPYVCKPGCPLGEVHSLLVPQNAFVRIVSGDTGSSCHRKCRCSGHGLLHQCRSTTCVAEEQCFLVNGGIYNHNSRFNITACNKCICYAGEVICTKRQCSINGHRSELQTRAQPCGCQSVYSPVCATNGRTYPNHCIARCQGLSDAQFASGACNDKDACNKNTCAVGQRCVTRRNVCLGDVQRSANECWKYECVNVDKDHCEMSRTPVCDTMAENHPNVCAMLSRNRRLAYFGRCQSWCSSRGVVCGVDGETYPSECTAWMAGNVLADYDGPCRTVAPLSDANDFSAPCSNVTCASHKTIGCSRPVLPPGACCPICAGEIRALVSGVLGGQAARRSFDSLDGVSSTDRPLTIGEIVGSVRVLISTQECQVFGYLSIEAEIVLLIAAITPQPTVLQVAACTVEADRIGALLSSSGPAVSVSPALSTLLAVEVRLSMGPAATAAAATGSTGYSSWWQNEALPQDSVASFSPKSSMSFHRIPLLSIVTTFVLSFVASSSSYRWTTVDVRWR